MEGQRRKVYVEVEVTHRVDGSARPNQITFENGEKYEIDRVIQRCRAASTKVGGTGIRYTVQFAGYLLFCLMKKTESGLSKQNRSKEGTEVKRLSRMDIEAIAEKYTRKYMELAEVQKRTVYRIDPELFLTKVLGLNIGYVHLSYDDSLLGLTSFEEVEVNVLTGGDEEVSILLDGKTILVEADLQYDDKLRGRKNFTLMHEGSHQIFKSCSHMIRHSKKPTFANPLLSGQQ